MGNTRVRTSTVKPNSEEFDIRGRSVRKFPRDACRAGDQSAEVAIVPHHNNRLGIDHTTWHWLWKETVNRIDRYQDAVNEGLELDAALAFARYILWSRLSDVLSQHDCDGPLKVDSSHMMWKAQELQRTVQDLYRKGKAVPMAKSTQLEAINHKLDLIAAKVSGYTFT